MTSALMGAQRMVGDVRSESFNHGVGGAKAPNSMFLDACVRKLQNEVFFLSCGKASEESTS